MADEDDGPDCPVIPARFLKDLGAEIAHAMSTGAPGRINLTIHHDQKGVVRAWDFGGERSRRADRENERA